MTQDCRNLHVGFRARWVLFWQSQKNVQSSPIYRSPLMPRITIRLVLLAVIASLMLGAITGCFGGGDSEEEPTPDAEATIEAARRAAAPPDTPTPEPTDAPPATEAPTPNIEATIAAAIAALQPTTEAPPAAVEPRQRLPQQSLPPTPPCPRTRRFPLPPRPRCPNSPAIRPALLQVPSGSAAHTLLRVRRFTRAANPPTYLWKRKLMALAATS